MILFDYQHLRARTVFILLVLVALCRSLKVISKKREYLLGQVNLTPENLQIPSDYVDYIQIRTKILLDGTFNIFLSRCKSVPSIKLLCTINNKSVYTFQVIYMANKKFSRVLDKPKTQKKIPYNPSSFLIMLLYSAHYNTIYEIPTCSVGFFFSEPFSIYILSIVIQIMHCCSNFREFLSI